MISIFTSRRHVSLPTALALCSMLQFHCQAAGGADEVVLAEGGKALLPIVAAADPQTERAAEDLAVYLEKISDSDFEVLKGSGKDAGIFVGAAGDFEDLPFSVEFDTTPADPDHYLIRSVGGTGLYIIGSTPQAVEFGVWDFLHRIGYRYFFPNEKWEIVPRLERVAASIDTTERPDYWNRSGPRGAPRQAHRPWSQEEFKRWRVRNRTAAGFVLRTGHAYDGIVRRNQAEFDAHPEYFALIDGVREQSRNPKFCISNPGLRRLVVEDSIRQAGANPEARSISLDPSDGSGWCDAGCQPCHNLGTVSDRVVLLANEVAAALEEKFETPCFVGIYAYNDYSPPPSIDLHPKVVPSLATAFIRGNLTFDEMLEGWSQHSNLLGIREYYGVSLWNSAMPGARAADIAYLARTIPEWHSKGARFMNAESDDSWGVNGLGHWLAARMLWDVSEAERVEELVDDFIHRAFGPAGKPMKEFYQVLTSHPQISEHLVGTMYSLLNEARDMASETPEVLARIDDLVLYTRYVELQRAFASAPPERKQEAFDELMAFVWRTRETCLVDTLGIIAWLHRQQRSTDVFNWPDGYAKVKPSDIHRKNEEVPHTRREIIQISNDGSQRNQTLDFQPTGFSHRLAPAAEALGLSAPPPLQRATRTRARAENYTWIEAAPAEIPLTLRTGTIYDNRGPATVALEWWDEDLDEFVEMESSEIEPGDAQEIVFTAEKDGLHRVVWSERMSGTDVVWPAELPRMTRAGEDYAMRVVGRDNWYFYVPRGTRTLGFYGKIRGGRLLDGFGTLVHDFDKSQPVADYFSFPVPEGADGSLWSFRNVAGIVQLLTVPPYVTHDPAQLLLPRELVEYERSQ